MYLLSTIKVTIDGEVLMDGDYGQWSSEPPDLVPQLLAEQATAEPRPWMLALLPVVTFALMRGRDTQVVVTTGERWRLEVDDAPRT